MTIAIMELSKANAEHLAFNQDVIIEMLCRGDAVLYGDRAQFELMNIDIPFNAVPVISMTGRKFIRKVLVEALFTTLSFAHARLKGWRRVVLLSTFPPLLLLLPPLARLTGIRLSLILHGELEGLLDVSRQRVTSYGYWVKLFLEKRLYRRVNCVVLGPGIHERLCALYPDATDYIRWGEIPVRFHARPDKALGAPITLGVAKFERQRALFDYLCSENIAFQHVGMCEAEIYDAFKDRVNFACRPGEALSRSDYEARVAGASVALVLYERNLYALTASAAMLDALCAGVPLITFPNPFARDLANAGLPVMCVDTMADVAAAAKEIAAHPAIFTEAMFDAFTAKRVVDALLSD